MPCAKATVVTKRAMSARTSGRTRGIEAISFSFPQCSSLSTGVRPDIAQMRTIVCCTTAARRRFGSTSRRLSLKRDCIRQEIVKIQYGVEQHVELAEVLPSIARVSRKQNYASFT